VVLTMRPPGTRGLAGFKFSCFFPTRFVRIRSAAPSVSQMIECVSTTMERFRAFVGDRLPKELRKSGFAMQNLGGCSMDIAGLCVGLISKDVDNFSEKQDAEKLISSASAAARSVQASI